LHEPLVPQVDAADVPHSLSGSVPLLMFAQVPSVPPVFDATHAWQSPPQAVLQHTPSAQLPLAHWSAAAHVEPFPFFATHAPVEQ